MFGFAPPVDYDTVRLQMGFWDALEISRSIASFLMGRFFYFIFENFPKCYWDFLFGLNMVVDAAVRAEIYYDPVTLPRFDWLTKLTNISDLKSLASDCYISVCPELLRQSGFSLK